MFVSVGYYEYTPYQENDLTQGDVEFEDFTV